MANEFYYDATVGFNGWFIAMPIMMLMMASIGAIRYSLDPKENKILKRGDGFLTFLKILSALLTALMVVMILHESSRGILQFIINTMAADDSIAWLPLVTAITALVGFCLIWVLLYGSARIGEWLTHGILMDVVVKRREKARLAKTRRTMEELRKLRLAEMAEKDKETYPTVEAEVIPPNWAWMTNNATNAVTN